MKTTMMSAFLVILTSLVWAGVTHLAPQTVVANSNGWTDLNNTLADDGQYATCTGAAQFSQRWLRDSLWNSDALGIDTAQNHITGVSIYVKGHSSNKRGKAQLQPYFGTTAGTASAALAMGVNVVTLTYDITNQRNDNPGWGGWRWTSLDSLNIQAAVRGNGLTFYIDYVFALVTYTSNVTGSDHYFVLSPSAVFDPETLGVSFRHTLTVHDVNTGLLMDTYNGSVVLSDSTGALSPTMAQVNSGTAIIDFAIFDTTTTDGTSPQRTVIRISDGDTFLLTNGFQVINGLYRYWFAPVATPQTMGVPFPVSVSALNAFDDTVTSYNGSASLAAALGFTTPDNITFAGGLWSGNVSITGAGEVWDSLQAYSGARPAIGYSNAFYLQGDPNPYITYTSPADGETNVAVEAPVIIGFSEAIDPGSFAYSCVPDPGGWSVVWNTGGDTVTLTHDSFAVATAYNFTVTAANDLNGNPLVSGPVPNPFAFTTIADITPPTIIYTSPADGATNVAVEAPVIIGFSEAIDPGSFAYACVPDPGGWSLSWNTLNDTVTLSHNNFAYSSSYTFTITSAQDTAGNDLAPGSVPNPFGFSTGASGMGGEPGYLRQPKYFSLSGIRPNPVKDEAIISFALPEECRVTIEVFNILGLKVATLADAKYPAGYHQVGWGGRQNSGQPATGGVYLLRMVTPKFTAIRKMILLR